MLKLTQPLLLPLQQPYPLIAHGGCIHAQMATLLVQNDDGEIDSYPVLRARYLIDGQVFSRDVAPGDTPYDDYFTIDCSMGDVIPWSRFIGISRRLFNQGATCSLTEIFCALEYYGVTVNDRPKDLFVFIRSFDDGVDFSHGEEMAFERKSNGVPRTKEEKYRDFIRQVAAHMELLPYAELHFLHNREDEGFLSEFNQMKSDVANLVANDEETRPTKPCLFSSRDYVGIAKYIQKEWLGRKLCDSEEMLQDVCEHFGFCAACKEHVWDYISKNFKIDK